MATTTFSRDRVRIKFGACLAVAIVVPLVVATPAAAVTTTRYVATTGDDTANDCTDSSAPCKTIQYAVDQANPGDTVSIAAGNYQEAVRTNISLTLEGVGATQTLVSGDGSDPGLWVDGGDTVVAPAVTASHMAFSNNSAAPGVAVEGGGAVALVAVIVADNADAGVFAADHSAVTVWGSALDGNAVDGLALDSTEGDAAVAVTGSDLSHNQGFGVAADAGDVTVAASTIAHNADGGLVGDGNTVDIADSTFYANTTVGVGAEDAAAITLANSTVAGTVDKSSPISGAVGQLGSGAVTMTGTITAANQTPDCLGAINDGGYNLDHDGTCALNATGSLASATAALGAFGKHGGLTSTLVPGLSSDARNRIPHGSAGCVHGAKDQRGVNRPQPADGRCDIGAVEVTVVNPKLHATVSAKHPPRHGWYRGTVAITFRCKLGTAPLEHGCPAAKMLRSSGKNQHLKKAVVALDGGRARVSVTGISIDNEKPKVRVAGAKDGETYGARRHLHAHCRDALSGVAHCRLVTGRNGSTVSYTAVATDRAGNVARKKGKYFVR
jgi:hypothetical protein